MVRRSLLSLILGLAAIALAASAGQAALGTGVLAKRTVTLHPGGVTIRLVASTTSLDSSPTGSVALWLTLERRSRSAFRVIRRVRVSDGFKLSSRLERFTVSNRRNAANVTIRWFITPAIGAITFNYVAGPTSLRSAG